MDFLWIDDILDNLKDISISLDEQLDVLLSVIESHINQLLQFVFIWGLLLVCCIQYNISEIRIEELIGILILILSSSVDYWS